MIEVIKPGLETSVQDYPGRMGYWNQGFPPSGPMDSWSFRLANLLVGNDAGAAGLECQFLGPTLKFHEGKIIAITGGDMQAKIDNEVLPCWESIQVSTGQTLEMSFAKKGVRSYIAISGGIVTEPWLNSRSTFHKAGVGGMEGHALKVGQMVPLGATSETASIGRSVPPKARPKFTSNKTWDVEVCRGPNDDWIDEKGHERFINTDWKLSAKSDRTGFRLDGPDWTFTEKAVNKGPEHGADPSNIIDQGYPIGAINLAGQTPIILMNDGPSMGGFINPYTVPSVGFWKLGQANPSDIIRFKIVSVEEAQRLRLELNAVCSANSII